MKLLSTFFHFSNHLTEGVEFSANKICYVRKIGEDGYSLIDCSKKARRYHLCRYKNVEIVWGPISAIPIDESGDYELIVEKFNGINGVIYDDFLGAKKRCEARGRDLLTIENAQKVETIAPLMNNFFNG